LLFFFGDLQLAYTMRASNDLTSIIRYRNISKVILILSALVFLFYLSVLVLIGNVYRYAVVGAIFELLSAPMLLLLVILPIACLVQLFSSKANAKWYAVASLVFVAAAILLLIQAS